MIWPECDVTVGAGALQRNVITNISHSLDMKSVFLSL